MTSTVNMAAVQDKLITARVGLLIKAPFFGNMSTRMQLVEASDKYKTAATDGRNFFYNKDFVNKLSVKKVEFLLCHEILHCVFDHFGRVGNRDRQLANIAMDFAVNQVLVDEKVGEVITEVDICQDNKYRGMAWEEIYDLLYEKAEKISMSSLLQQLGDLLDDHMKESSPGDSDDDNGNKEGNKGPTLSKEEMQAIRDEIKQAMIQSAAAAGAGKTPASIQRLIKDLTEPKMDWRTLIRQEIQSIVRNDYSFQRPNRKSWHSGAILPGMTNDTTIDVCIAIDMSGSIGDADAMTFLSEVKGIMDQYQDYKITLWTFDTRTYNPQVITQDNGAELLEYDLQGGGGTDFDVNFEFMKQEDIKPKKFLMFTDGFPGGSWGDPDYTDTLFIIKGNTTAQAPYGQTVIYESV